MEFDVVASLNSLASNFSRFLPLLGYVALALGIFFVGASLSRFISASETPNEIEKRALANQAIWMIVAGGLLLAITSTVAYFVGTFGFEANDMEARIMQGAVEQGNDFLSSARSFTKVMFTIAGLFAIIRAITLFRNASENSGRGDADWKAVLSYLVGGSLAIAHEDFTVALAKSTGFEPLIRVVNAFWGSG